MRKKSLDIETRLRQAIEDAIANGTPLMRIAMDAGVGYHAIYGFLRRGRKAMSLTVAEKVWFALTGRRFDER